MIIEESLIIILNGLILSAIIGAGSSIYVLIKNVNRQATDIKLMKKANIIVLGMIVKDSKRLHGEENITDIEAVYKELINSN